MIHSHCTSAALLAERMGLDADVQEALRYTFERYDGGGLPGGVHGDAIPVEMRVAQLADMVEVHHRTGGVEGAVAMVRTRRGGQFDPVIADAFIGDAERMLAGPTVGDSWAAALHEAPDRGQRIDGAELDALLEALGDFVDLKCPFTLGHSRAVADARRRRRRDGRTRQRHGDADPAGGSRPRPGPHRGVQPDLVETRGADSVGVRTRAAASLSDGPHPQSGQRP